MHVSKVVSPHLWNTPLNLYQQAISRDSFHSWRPGDCRTGVLYGSVVIFLEVHFNPLILKVSKLSNMSVTYPNHSISIDLEIGGKVV